MNQMVYNNRDFYFDSQKYSVDYSNNNNQNNQNIPNKENIPNNIENNQNNQNILITIRIKKHKKKKNKERIIPVLHVPVIAGKGYVAARLLQILKN